MRFRFDTSRAHEDSNQSSFGPRLSGEELEKANDLQKVCDQQRFLDGRAASSQIAEHSASAGDAAMSVNKRPLDLEDVKSMLNWTMGTTA